MRQQQISEHIRSDAVVKTVNLGKQAIHDRESSAYISGRSYLLPGVDAQELVDRYHGTGDIRPSKNGAWNNKEVVVADGIIGVNVDHKTGTETITNRFTIHYSNTGTHIVPAKTLGR